jgi:hypothetical protein
MSTSTRQIPLPTAAQRDEACAATERRRVEEARRRAADAVWDRAMRGRHVTCLGHDGRYLYVRFDRPHYARPHISKVNLQKPLTGPQALFIRWAALHGMNLKNFLYWAI